MLQSFLSKLFKKNSAEDTLVPLLWRNQEKKMLFFWYNLFTRLPAAELVLSRWKLSARWSKTTHATIGLRSRHRFNPRPTRFVSGKASECRWRIRRYQVDPWSRGREVARGVLHSSANLKKAYFLPSERDRHFSSPVLYTAAPKCVV